jgi:hypothetical protein
MLVIHDSEEFNFGHTFALRLPRISVAEFEAYLVAGLTNKPQTIYSGSPNTSSFGFIWP